MRDASRCLFLCVNPSTDSTYSSYNFFEVSEEGGRSIMAVNENEKIKVSDKSHLVDFLDMFSITDSEKNSILDSLSEGDKIPFSQIEPSSIVKKTYSEMVDLGLLRDDDLII
jgi:hypothetical protein